LIISLKAARKQPFFKNYWIEKWFLDVIAMSQWSKQTGILGFLAI